MRRPFLVPVILGLLGCGDDGGTDGAGGDASGAGGTTGPGGTLTGAGGGASGTGVGGGSAATGSGSGTSSGGGVPACVTEQVVLAVAGTTSECGFPLPEGADDGVATVVIDVNGSFQPLCRRFSSQGCGDGGSPGGWWTNGGEVLLCDDSCTAALETPGAELTLWLGCETDYCL